MDIKKAIVILGQEWMLKWNVRYSRKRKLFFYPWASHISSQPMPLSEPHLESQPPLEPHLEPPSPPPELHPELLPEIIAKPELLADSDLPPTPPDEPELDLDPVLEQEPESEHDFVDELELVAYSNIFLHHPRISR